MDSLSKFPRFAARISKVCDEHPQCPPLHKGRQVWLQDQLQIAGVKVSVESVRKWLAGETRPREDKASAIGQVLGVDGDWLRTGKRTFAADIPEEPNPPSTSNNSVAPPLHIGIRYDHSVEIRNLPLNLTKLEATKLANILLAHATCE